jgi:hypothetical protein
VLLHCLERLQRIGKQLAVPCEFLFVDDGSRDGGAEYMARQAVTADPAGAHEPQCRQGSRDDGRARDAVVTLGVDPPQLMPRVVSAWREGADVELMRRRTRAGESLGKRINAHPFYRALNRISDFDTPADAGDFRLLGRKAVQQLPERNRYMKGLLPGSAWRPG